MHTKTEILEIFENQMRGIEHTALTNDDLFRSLMLELLIDIRDELLPISKYFNSLHVVQEKEDKK